MPGATKGSVPREQFDDPRLERLAREVQELRKILSDCPFVRGRQVGPIVINELGTIVAHKLGRAPKGFLIFGTTPGAWVAPTLTQPNDLANFISLYSVPEAGSDARVLLWFF